MLRAADPPQTTADVIAGFEEAWRFFGGVFATVVPDNLSAIVDAADPLAPRLNQAFVEYGQARGFQVDPARVRRPQDKPRVERVVPFVRSSFFAGEIFIDLADAQRRAETWCRQRAGRRVHGTTQCRPIESFTVEEQPHLLPAPTEVHDVPVYVRPKVHRDHHVEVPGRAPSYAAAPRRFPTLQLRVALTPRSGGRPTARARRPGWP